MIPEFSGSILSPDYKLFLFSIYAAGVLTGAMVFSIVAAYNDSRRKAYAKK
jgi:hypothetical protein